MKKYSANGAKIIISSIRGLGNEHVNTSLLLFGPFILYYICCVVM